MERVRDRNQVKTGDDVTINEEEPRNRGGMWILLALLIVAVVVIGFFALGGDADVDSEGGDIDIETPTVDVDIDAPDIDVDGGQLPAVDIDGGESPSVDVDPTDVDADAGDG